MGYLFAVVSVILGNAKGYCGKKSSGYLKNDSDAVLINVFRMVICTLIGLCIILFSHSSLDANSKELLIFIMSGVSSALFVVFWLLCVKEDAYLMLDIFLLLGTVIPITVSAVMFGESIKFTQIIGIAVLLVSVFLMCGYNNNLKGKMKKSGIIILLLCGVFNGCSDLSQKLYVKTTENMSAVKFNFYTYLFAFAVLLIAYIIKKKAPSAEPMKKTVFIYVLIMAVCLFGCSYFKTIAAKTLNSAILYPLSQGLSLINSSLMAAFLFKEKPNKQSIIGVITAFIGLMILNV